MNKKEIINKLKEYDLDKNEFVILSSSAMILKDIKNEIKRGKDVLVEHKDKENEERTQLEEALKNIENLLNNKASDDEIVREYEDLTNKINNFIDSEPNKEEENKPSKPEASPSG